MKKNEMKKRFRRYEAVRTFEYETHNKDKELISDMTEAEWREKVIQELSSVDCEEIWFIFHDKDMLPATETSPAIKKGLHVHITVIFANGRYPEPVAELLNTNVNQMNKVGRMAGVMRYMTHTNDGAMNDRKYRYSIEELYAYKRGIRMTEDEKRAAYTEHIVGKEVANETERDFVQETIVQVLNGEVMQKDLRQVFIDEFGMKQGSNLFMDNKRKLYSAVDQYREEFIYRKRTEGRSLVTVYIEGQGNVGKTTLARLMCQYQNKKHGFQKDKYFESSADGKSLTSDPFQNYEFEYSTLLDEFMPEQNLGFTSFNKYFNQTGIVDVASRQNVKPWYSDFCIISKSRPLVQTVNALFKEASIEEQRDPYNVRLQIQRRIPINIVFEKNHITVKKFNVNENKYEIWNEYKGDTKSHEFLTKFLQETNILIEEVRASFEIADMLDVDLID